jgi:hypothetical protein
MLDTLDDASIFHMAVALLPKDLVRVSCASKHLQHVMRQNVEAITTTTKMCYEMIALVNQTIISLIHHLEIKSVSEVRCVNHLSFFEVFPRFYTSIKQTWQCDHLVRYYYIILIKRFVGIAELRTTISLEIKYEIVPIETTYTLFNSRILSSVDITHEVGFDSKEGRQIHMMCEQYLAR